MDKNNCGISYLIERNLFSIKFDLYNFDSFRSKIKIKLLFL
jgi:hypothetical protein